MRVLELKAEVWQRLEEREGVVSTLFEIAEVWISQAGKPESAAPILERVLEFDPANRDAYERVLKLYADAGDWRAYASALDRYLPNLVTDEDKVKALRELGRIREQRLGQKDGAFLALCRALQLDPSDDSLREGVERLAEETGSFEELAAVYEQVADELPKGPLAERLYLVLARVQDRNLDDPGEAEAALRKSPGVRPHQRLGPRRHGGDVRPSRARPGADRLPGAEDGGRSLARGAQDHPPRGGPHPPRAAQRPRGVGCGADAVTGARARRGDPGRAGTLYREQHLWGDLAATLVRTRDLLPNLEERSQLQLKVAEVQEREIGDEEAAVEAYRQALELDPRNGEALDSLERLYTKLDRPADLLAIYERQLELTEDYREKVKILFHSAAIWEDRYQNPANADACIEGVLALDPTNLQAIKSLERLRRAQERWEDLVGVLERHIQLATESKEQADLIVETGEVLRSHLHQTDKAANAFQMALEIFPGHAAALHALGTVYERSGNWPFALEMLNQEAQALGRDPKAVEVLHRMGKINEDMLMDVGSAKACYAEALRINPDYLPSLQALRGIYESEQNWEAFEQTLVAEAQATDEAGAKARAYLAIGKYHSERREDAEAAAQWYEEAVRLDPELAEAALPLSDISIAKEKWEQAEKMLDVVIRDLKARLGSEKDEALERELCRQVYRMGYVQEKLGRRDRALASYEEAYQLDSTYLPALEGYGNLLVQSGRYDQALKIYQTILIHHREDLTDLEIVEIYWQIGEVHIALQQHDRAQNHFDKALAIDPGHEPSLRALVQLADGAGRWDRAAEYRQALVGVLDGEPKAEVALELGRLAKEKLKDSHLAIDAYAQALQIRPESLEVMDALYMLYRETRQPGKAAEVLERMLAQPELRADPQRAKRVWFALGESLRDELRDTDRAVEAFNAALDLDPRFIEAFSAIEALLGAAKQWKPLEENYARMIQRLPKTDDTEAARMALWRTLGDLYLQILKQPESALMAYQVAAAGLPDDAVVQEILRQSPPPGSGERGQGGGRAPPGPGPYPESEEGGQPARRGRRAAKGLRRGVARRAGGVGAPRRGRSLGEGDPFQARSVRQEAGDAAGDARRPAVERQPPPPPGAQPLRRADGRALPGRGSALGDAAGPGGVGSEEAPHRRLHRAGVPDPPLPGGGAPAGDGGGGAVLALPSSHPGQAGQALHRARSRPAPRGGDRPRPAGVPEDRREVLRRPAGQGYPRPPGADAGPPPPGADLCLPLRSRSPHRGVSGRGQPRRLPDALDRARPGHRARAAGAGVGAHRAAACRAHPPGARGAASRRLRPGPGLPRGGRTDRGPLCAVHLGRRGSGEEARPGRNRRLVPGAGQGEDP